MCQEFCLGEGRECLPHYMLGYIPLGGHTHPTWADTPLADTPWADTHGHTPPGQTPLPSRWPLQWTVRILLECILVFEVTIIQSYMHTHITKRLTGADTGFPIGGGINPPGGGCQHTNLPDSLKNCMKLRKFWSVGGRMLGAPPWICHWLSHP